MLLRRTGVRRARALSRVPRRRRLAMSYLCPGRGALRKARVKPGAGKKRSRIIDMRCPTCSHLAPLRSRRLREGIFAREGGRCFYCGCVVSWGHLGRESATLKYVDPLGPGVAQNLVLACRWARDRGAA